MAEWEKKDLDEYFPSEITGLVTDISDVAEDVADIFDTVADFVDTLADWMIDYADPIAVIVDALIQEITLFIGDLRRAGAFALPVVPKGREYRDGIEGFYRAVNLSLRDEADLDRPQFSPSAQILGYAFVYGATDLKTLYEDFLAQAKFLFDVGEFKDWAWGVNPDLVPTRDQRRSNSKPPDWKAIRVADFWPPYDDFLGEMQKMVASLKRGRSTKEFVGYMAQALRNKAQQLNFLADYIEFFATEVEALFNMTGVWFIKVGPVNGLEAWLAELIEAANKPPFPGDEWYVAGIVVLAGGPDTAALEELLG